MILFEQAWNSVMQKLAMLTAPLSTPVYSPVKIFSFANRVYR